MSIRNVAIWNSFMATELNIYIQSTFTPNNFVINLQSTFRLICGFCLLNIYVPHFTTCN